MTAQDFLREGVRLHNATEFAAGLHALDRAIELNPRMASAYLWRGYCNSDLHRFPQAIADYTRSLGTLSGSVRCFGKRGASYLDSGKPDEALADLNRAIELNPAYGSPCNTAAGSTSSASSTPRRSQIATRPCA